MQRIIEIKGMTCGHCEGRVTNEILTIPGVTNVIATAEKATAVIESSSDISDELIEIAVRNAGYAVNK